MEVLAKRLQLLIQELVGPHQTCGIKERSIYTNIVTARSVLEYCDAGDTNVAMIQKYFKNAFDKVSPDILFSVLERVKLGSVIKELEWRISIERELNREKGAISKN